MKYKEIIVLDPGHGGHDPGAVNKNYKEKVLALELTLKIKLILENQGYKVILTRNTDEFIELKERANIANNANGHIFISIHLNSYGNKTVQGLEIFHYPGSVEGNKLSVSIYNQMTKDNLYTKREVLKLPTLQY